VAKVGQHWAKHAGDFSGLRHWTEIPEVKARINRKVTGDASADLFGYVIRKYFQEGGRQWEQFLSLGSGSGELERGLSQYVIPKIHLGIEISADLVGLASEQAAGFPHIRYRQADLNTCELGAAQYDLVIAHQSLHHVLNLEGLFDRIKRSMKPNAVFIFDEYVGPRRFQWSDRQLQAINGVIEVLPSRLNKDVQTGRV
jgi:SAM-dependent methyltransferase